MNARPKSDYPATLQEQRSGYERYAARYDRLVGTIIPDMKYRRTLVRLLPLRPGDRVIVYACGTGRDFEPIEHVIGARGHITAIDLTPGMLQRARDRAYKHGWNNIEFLCEDVSTMPTRRLYNAAICSFAMSVIPDYQAAFRKMLSSVRPGGYVGILDVKTPRWRPLQTLVHRFITRFLPEYEESRPVPDLIKSALHEIQWREFFLGYIYCASGKKANGRTR
ncbi:MAG: class I SAM-dependent methyltransferase [Leptospiraceae bacterium]|nr:class I SAM-dependent methyltransferase [Leptospiraceae bacterium]